MSSQRLTAALEAIQAFVGDNPAPEKLVLAAKCRGLMAGYDARWCGANCRILAVESLIQSDLWNPESGRKSRSFRVAGVKDVSFEHEGRVVLMDHKTTSDDITDPSGPYWRQLVVESQPSHYMLLDWLNGNKADGAMWDVVRKPGISPKQISTKRDLAEIRSSGAYFGRTISAESLAALDIEARETPEMYEARLAWDCTERPEHYFQRRSVPRLDTEIHEYATELWDHSQELLYVRRTNRHSRNSGACMLYKRPCEFLGICSGHDTADGDRWQRPSWVHPELPILQDSDGRDVLTNSRIRCFQTCRRKHFYRYELGIKRQEEEESEALYFGSLWHAAQAAWFRFDLEKENDVNSNSDTSANSVETAAIN